MPVTKESVEKLVQERWVPEFRYVHNHDVPWTPFRGPAKTARIALVTTAGVFVKGDHPFDDHWGLGDPSYREIPSDVAVRTLTVHHEHVDLSNAVRDINVVFPIERLRELAEAGEVGSIHENAYSFMGYVPIPAPLIRMTAPRVAAKLAAAGVDAALLVPS